MCNILCIVSPYCFLTHKCMKNFIIVTIFALLFTSCRTPIASVTTNVKETVTIRDTLIKTPLPTFNVKESINLDTIKLKPITIVTPTATVTVNIKDNNLVVDVTNKDSVEVKAPIIEKVINTTVETVKVKKETPKLVLIFIGFLIFLIIVLFIRVKFK